MSWLVYASVALAIVSLLVLVVPGVIFLVAGRIPPSLEFLISPLGRRFRAQPGGAATAEQVRLVGWQCVSFGAVWCAQPMLIWSTTQDELPSAVRPVIAVVLLLALVWTFLTGRKLRATL
ncbi:hypothetical protein [Pseudonocardia sp. TRM90224]|uniref:hypothetical protein n=1 Tax=Pseudonocardia sp. TRM90224 TaxID=2812678 RepID=UPI001E60CE74|nr:hypothetical protein [Pseudonocardia sp. TRM90224]